ncbi:hypothetical protein HKD37_06G017014 [Glycine soja]
MFINSLQEQASQGFFVAHGRQGVLTAAIGRPEYPGRVRAAGAVKCSPSFSRRCNHRDSHCFLSLRLVLQLLGTIQTRGTQTNAVYIEENPPCLVALGNVYEGSTTVRNIPLLHDQVKVGVEEVRDVDAPIPVPTEEVKLVGQTLNIFLAWLTHLVKRLSEQGVVGPTKLANRPYREVDDPLYLMTLTIPQLFLKPLQVMWDASMFGNSKRDVYLGAYLNGAYWQIIVILPKENVVIWFCSLHNRSDNYLKGIINRSVLFFNTFALALVGNINILIDLTILHKVNRRLVLGGLLLNY